MVINNSGLISSLLYKIFNLLVSFSIVKLLELTNPIIGSLMFHQTLLDSR